MAMDILKRVTDDFNKKKINKLADDNQVRIETMKAKAAMDTAQATLIASMAKSKEAEDKGLVAQKQADNLSADTAKKGNEALKTNIENIKAKMEGLGGTKESKTEASSPDIDETLAAFAPAPVEEAMPAEPMIEEPQAAPAPIAPEPISPNMQKFLINQARDDAAKQEIANNNYLKQIKVAKDRVLKMEERYRYYENNPLDTRQALANVSWNKYIAAALHNLVDDLNPNPQQNTVNHVQRLIDQEVQAMKTERQHQMGAMQARENLYENYFRILKDERAAELATQSTMFDVAGKIATLNNKIQTGANLALTARAKKAQAEKAEHELALAQAGKMSQKDYLAYKRSQQADRRLFQKDRDFAYGVQQDKLDRIQKLEDRAWEQQKLGIKMARKEKEDRLKAEPFEMNLNLPTGNVVVRGVDKKAVSKYKEEVSKRVVASRYNIPRISKLAETIKNQGFFKTAKSVVPFLESKEGKEFDELLLKLQAIMLSHRIDYTGGGNMNVAELRKLEKAFKAYESPIKRYNAIKRGEVKRMLEGTLAAGFFNTLVGAEQHFEGTGQNFNSLDRGQKLAAIQNKLQMTDEQMYKIFKFSNKDKWNRDAWEKAKLGPKAKSPKILKATGFKKGSSKDLRERMKQGYRIRRVK